MAAVFPHPDDQGAVGALEGTKVVDLSTDVAGAFATKVLADLGACVTLVEPPDGSPLRRRPPVPDGAAHGPLFAYLSGGKRSVQPGDDHELVAALLDDSDVVVRDDGSPYGPPPGDPLPAHVIDVVISDFGRSGPYAGWCSSDLAMWAMGGYMYFTGDESREPLWIPGSQAQFHCGVHSAFATLSALYERGRSGQGQQVEVRTIEAVLGAHCWLVSRWMANGAVMRRTSHGLTATKDGWASGMVPPVTMSPNPQVLELIGRADLIPSADTADGRERALEAIDEWAGLRTSQEIFEAAQDLGLVVTPVFDAAEVADGAQLAERGWWEPMDDPELGPMRFPGQPFRLTGSPATRQGPAPKVGEHTAALRAQLAERASGPSRREGHRSDGSKARNAPFDGLKIVEVSTNWAAPVCCRYLADLGADVIKVERASRPATRIEVVPGSPPDPLTQPYNRALYFNELNRNKREVVLDLATPDGVDVLKSLVREADILVENNTARVMPKLGLGYEVLSEINPALIMLSITAFGADGPWRDHRAMGSNLEGTSGLNSVMGYRDDQPYRTSMFYGDPIGGIFSALALVSALAARDRTGRGQWIDLSLNECATIFFSEPLVEHLSTGSVRRPAGNRDPRFAPQGAYPCAGFDNWVAISVQSDDQWERLASRLGRPDWAGAEDLAHVAGRHRRHDEIDAAIETWTRERTQYEVSRELQAIGISAAPVLANWQVLADPHIHALGFYVPVEHPAVGVYPQASWPWHFSATPASIRRPAPLFAQHNTEILAELGLDQSAIDRLHEMQVTADAPTPEAARSFYASTIRPPAPPGAGGAGPQS